MEIRINTNDILGDETTIREQIIDQVAQALVSYILSESKKLIRDTLNETLTGVIKEKAEELAELHLDTEFTETDTRGKVKGTSTVRAKIADELAKQCVVKNASYASDRNAFTNTVIKTVEAEMGKFQKEFNSLVTRQVVEQSMTEAVKRMRVACGLPPEK